METWNELSPGGASPVVMDPPSFVSPYPDIIYPRLPMCLKQYYAVHFNALKNTRYGVYTLWCMFFFLSLFDR